jgi:hypothetical protein
LAACVGEDECESFATTLIRRPPPSRQSAEEAAVRFSWTPGGTLMMDRSAVAAALEADRSAFINALLEEAD